MLLELAQELEKYIRAFNVFSYITLRVVLAALTALVISFIVGPAMIRKLTAYKIGQAVRDDGPQTHLVKSGTPTMGGALILVSVAVTTILWADLSNKYVWIVLLTTLGFGAVGWVDDWRKVVHRNPKGLSARAKFAWQSVIAIVAGACLAFSPQLPPEAGSTLCTAPLSVSAVARAASYCSCSSSAVRSSASTLAGRIGSPATTAYPGTLAVSAATSSSSAASWACSEASFARAVPNSSSRVAARRVFRRWTSGCCGDRSATSASRPGRYSMYRS
jgi:hypothetical protein